MRLILAVAAVLAAGGVGLAQATTADDERKENERKQKEEAKKLEEEWKGYFKNTSELPDLAAKVPKAWAALPTETVGKDDPPAVRAAKRAINAEAERLRLICLRIEAGSYSGGSQYTQFTECVFGQYTAATLLHDEPEKLLPFAEAVVVALMRAEDFNFPRVRQGLEEPQLLSHLQAARCRAEVVVLKLREQVKAKKK